MEISSAKYGHIGKNRFENVNAEFVNQVQFLGLAPQSKSWNVAY